MENKDTSAYERRLKCDHFFIEQGLFEFFKCAQQQIVNKNDPLTVNYFYF